MSILGKVRDYCAFAKMRLTFLVVFSAATGYLMGAEIIEWQQFFYLLLGGFLVTASSNGINQIIERDFDKLMDRTRMRPLPDSRMTLNEAYLIASVSGISGLYLLFFFVSPLCCLLGGVALALYTLAYTPLKRHTPFAVLVGAFPGAMPPMLGWVAATGYIGIEAVVLYTIQFVWQFPHFWAIAWVMDDDYKKAGFRMLPSGERDKASAFQVVIYTIALIPVSMLPVFFRMSSAASAIAALLCGVWFLIYAINLYNTGLLKTAKNLMLASFVYLPVVQVILILTKI